MKDALFVIGIVVTILGQIMVFLSFAMARHP